MAHTQPIEVYLEIGSKRVFAGAIEWPGWCRSGKTEDLALEALLAYGPRYVAVVKGGRPSFGDPPASVDDLRIVKRLQGDATTDFGAPSIAPEADARPVDAKELRRLRRVLEASWASFDRAADAAEGVELTTGPRGGGRSLPKIVGHVVGAESGYARRILARTPDVDGSDAREVVNEERAIVLAALSSAVTDGLPAAGPRGGKLWSPRYFVRRAAWHVLDHAWEIEDRAT